MVLKWFNSLSRRKTFVGGKCALPSALLVGRMFEVESVVVCFTGRRIHVDTDDLRLQSVLAERTTETRLFPRRHRLIVLHCPSPADHRPLLADWLPCVEQRRSRLRQHLRCIISLQFLSLVSARVSVTG